MFVVPSSASGPCSPLSSAGNGADCGFGDVLDGRREGAAPGRVAGAAAARSWGWHHVLGGQFLAFIVFACAIES